MEYIVPFLLGLVCGIAGMMGTPKSREAMRERAAELKRAELIGWKAGYEVGSRDYLDKAHGRMSAALRR